MKLSSIFSFMLWGASAASLFFGSFVLAQSEPTRPAACVQFTNTQNWIDTVTSTATSITVTLENPLPSLSTAGSFVVNLCQSDGTSASPATREAPYTPGEAITFTKTRSGSLAPDLSPNTDYWVRISGSYGTGSSDWHYIKTKSAGPIISISTTATSITEGGSASFTVTASEAPSAQITVNLTVADDDTSDFIAPTNQGDKTVTFGTSDTTKTHTVATVDDGTDEADGSISVTVASGTGYSVSTTSASASVAVTDNDDPPANSPATGAPTISGFPQVGQTLTAATSGIADTDGLTGVSYSYQWVRVDGANETDIASATSSTYTLAIADNGKTIKVKVTFQDDASNSESLTSAATGNVVSAAPACTSGNAWCATLTVGGGSVKTRGSPTGFCSGVNVCPTAYGSLSDNDFVIGITTYTVKSIRWGAGANRAEKLHLTLDTSLSAGLKNRFTLNVDSNALALSTAATSKSGTAVPNNYNMTSPVAVRGYAVGRQVTVDLVLAANNAPTVANVIPDQTATAGTAFSFAFNTNTFNDADVDTLSYTATKSDGTALPSWLTFAAGTRTFSGTPAAGDVGTLSIKVTASDGNGGSISDTFDITVSSAAADPTITISTTSTTVTEGASVTFTVNANPYRTPGGRARATKRLQTDALAVIAYPHRYPTELVLFLCQRSRAAQTHQRRTRPSKLHGAHRVILIDALPVTAHGKLDRTALHESIRTKS